MLDASFADCFFVLPRGVKKNQDHQCKNSLPYSTKQIINPVKKQIAPPILFAVPPELNAQAPTYINTDASNVIKIYFFDFLVISS